MSALAGSQDILRGTLDLLILRALSFGPAHGYAIGRWIEGATDDLLALEEGTLYPALYRLQERKLVTAQWGVSENNRRAKYYRLTADGKRRLQEETASWTRYARAIFAALEAPADTNAGRS
ncbi:MAG: PadR family transcriptional regulator [Gemmatimonadales bacterium]